MNRLIFACMASPGMAARQALLLAHSIRAFAGDLSGSPIWILVPEAAGDLSESDTNDLMALDARVIRFVVDPAALTFPFAGKVFAAAAAESLAAGEVDQLVWMDTGSIVAAEPRALLLDDRITLGYRPVDHRLIGSLIDQPLDAFWTLVYRVCQVSDTRVFPMTTSADESTIRPYFNAGMLVVRPEKGLLSAWRSRFESVYRLPEFEAFYKLHPLYQIFVHQAILAGELLSALVQREMVELPCHVNYPLHMHDQYPASRRPQTLNDLVSFRYEDFFSDPDWEQIIPAHEPLKSWLAEHVRLLAE
jgi:hypothetical protein